MGAITAAKAQGIVARYRKEGARARSLIKKGRSSAASITALLDTIKFLKKNGRSDLATALAGEQQAMYRINELKGWSEAEVAKDRFGHHLALKGTQAALTKYRRQVRAILAELVAAEESNTDVTVHFPTGRTTYAVGDRIYVLVNDGTERDGHKMEGEVVSTTPYAVTIHTDDGTTETFAAAGTLITVMVSFTLNETQQKVLLEATVFGDLMNTPTPERDRLVALGLAKYQGHRLVLTEKGDFVAKEVRRTLFVRNARKAEA